MTLKNSFVLLTGLILLSPMSARADHLSFGAGITHLGNPNQTDFEIGGEYEHNLDAFFGVGLEANYVFANPSVTMIGAPEGFVHPLGTDFFVSAAPLFEFSSGFSTQVGVRFGTKIPLPLGVLILIPLASVDFINGGTNFSFGLGIQI